MMGSFFMVRVDCTGCHVINTGVKILAVLEEMVYGVSSSAAIPRLYSDG